MKSLVNSSLAVLATVLILAVSTTAAVPSMFNYQGYLTDSGGNPINGTVAITFSICADSVGSSCNWTEFYPTVMVTDGQFNVKLGSNTPIIDNMLTDPERWLGIVVDGESLPYTQLVSVPFAHRVSTVDGASGGTISGDVSVESNITVSGKATIGPGCTNTGSTAFVAGSNNSVSGNSVILGGANNTAEGDYSYACGKGAKAIHQGTFVWADASGGVLESTESNQFVIRASGGTKVYSNADQSAGVTIHAGASAWAVNSDRNLKENFTPIDGKELLEKIAALPISKWNYKTQSKNVKHIGPVAQDFHAAFGLGDDDVTISTIDPAGVALAGIKELMNENRQLRVLIERLEHRLEQLEAR